MKKQIFTIQLLEDKDYLKMHKQFPNIEEKDLHDSLGFADKEAGEAYIRKTSVEDIDMNTVQHEIQELMSETSEHEKDGIRFGFFSKIGKWAEKTFLPEKVKSTIQKTPIIGDALSRGWFGAIPQQFTKEGQEAYSKGTGTSGILHNYVYPAVLGAIGGPLAGAAYGAANAPHTKDIPGGALKGAAMGSLGQGGVGMIKGATDAAPGFLSKAGGAISGAGKAMGLPGFGEGGKLSTLGSPKVAPGAIKGTGTTLYGGADPSTGYTPGGINAGKAAPLGSPNVKLFGGPAPGGAPDLSKMVSPGISPTPGGVGEAAPTSFWDKAKGLITPENILGLGSTLGSMAVPQPEFQMPSSVEDIRSKILAQTEEGQPGGLTQLGQQAQLELGNIMSTPASELYPTGDDAYYDAALRRTRENYERAQEELDKVYNSAGVFGTGEHMAQKAKLQEELARTESALAAEVEQRRFELARNSKYQAIQDSLGVDRAVMDDLIGISGLDVQTTAMMYGAEAADVQAIREALGTLGAELLVRGGQKETVASPEGASIG